MVVHIQVGRDGKGREFDEVNINIKQIFGEYAVLFDKKMNPVPLKGTGEPLEPLEKGGHYTVELLGYGSKSEEIIRKAKRQYQEMQAKKKLEIARQRSEQKQNGTSDGEDDLFKEKLSELEREKAERNRIKQEARQRLQEIEKIRDERLEGGVWCLGCFWSWRGVTTKSAHQRSKQRRIRELNRSLKKKKKKKNSDNNTDSELEDLLSSELGS